MYSINGKCGTIHINYDLASVLQDEQCWRKGLYRKCKEKSAYDNWLPILKTFPALPKHMSMKQPILLRSIFKTLWPMETGYRKCSRAVTMFNIVDHWVVLLTNTSEKHSLVYNFFTLLKLLVRKPRSWSWKICIRWKDPHLYINKNTGKYLLIRNMDAIN